MKCRLFIAFVLGLHIASTEAAHVFTRWTAFNLADESASGLLGSIAVGLTTDVAVPRPGSGDNGGIVAVVTNGSFTGFSDAVFTPQMDATDTIVMGAASSYTLTFSPPVINPTLHFRQLYVNRLSFSDGTNPIGFTLLSSDGDFTDTNGATSTALEGKLLSGGAYGGDDASGSILFQGSFSRIRWVSSAANLDDGYSLQISIPYAPVLAITQTGQRVSLRWLHASAAFAVEATTNLSYSNSWSQLSVPQTNQNGVISAALPMDVPERFFRLKETQP